MVTLATIRLWGQPVGVVSWDADRARATFAYEPAPRSPTSPPSFGRG
ncbi:hypothetical protein Q5H89_20320 [Hymenobacter sp. CA2-7]|nr:hypothetical protein [Hymenobacter sp. CA2-7]